MMGKYISEDILLEDLWDSKCESDILRRVRQAIVDEIIGIEGIDIVFCKECKHRPIKEEADGDDYGFNLIEPTEDDELCPCLVSDGFFSWMPPDNFFCGYGERKGADDK